MKYLDPVGYLFVTFSYNVTPIGKIWLTVMILLRMLMAICAGDPLYRDEQERFICNTLQPGCSNVCYDIYSPVSYMRYWLIQTVMVFLPYALFSVHVLNKAIKHMTKVNDRCRKSNSYDDGLNTEIPDFSLAYIVHLLLRTVLEAGFCAGQYFLFGILVPKRFSCSEPPCTSSVDCFISRPTEKSLMMIFIWGTAAISLILSVVDLIYVANGRRRRSDIHKKEMLLENDSLKGGFCSNTPPNTKPPETPEQMIIYTECPSNDLEGINRQIKGDSHSLPSLEGETASFQTEGSHPDVGKSNANANSNKAHPWQISIKSPGGSTIVSEQLLVTQRQPRCRKELSGDSAKQDSAQSDKNTACKTKKSAWV
ncbi:gap junction delta-4 protein [Spea bombifrons]|uniref:gap junction delta-4 protein n=1 Tax=Spea bombifrons TaxID=233779 RepID=UPI002349F2BF|nr:gap junction delta-4 protein [Spea bombifrons]